jgi:multiple sugar transport system substrate-binding protein
MKRTVVLVLVIALALAFVGCKKKDAASGASGTGGAGGEVTFWSSMTGTSEAAVRHIVEQYNATNPAQKIHIETVPGTETEVTKLMTAVRGGTGPDIYYLDRFTVAERAAGGLIQDITAQVKAIDPDIQSKYLPFAWAEAQFKGKTYALPFDTDVRAIFYRKDVLREAGVDPALLDPAKGPVTVAQLTDIAKKLNVTDAQGNYTRVGFIPFAQSFQGWHYIWGFVFGGKFADVAANKVTPTDPGVVAAYQYLYDYAKELGPQIIQTFLSTYAPPNFPPQQSAFLTGNLPIMVNGDWTIADIAAFAPQSDYGITYLPVHKAGDKPTSFAGGWSLVVPTGAKNVEGAVKFIAYACGEPGQRIYTVESRHLPTWNSLRDDASLFTPEHQFFRTSLLPIAQSRPVLPMHAFYWDQLTAAQDAVSLNTKTPLEALQAVLDASQPQLDKFK